MRTWEVLSQTPCCKACCVLLKLIRITHNLLLNLHYKELLL